MISSWYRRRKVAEVKAVFVATFRHQLRSFVERCFFVSPDESQLLSNVQVASTGRVLVLDGPRLFLHFPLDFEVGVFLLQGLDVNMVAVIRQHNSAVMRGARTVQENPPSEKPCNGLSTDHCPLIGVCQIRLIVHKATVVAGSGENQRNYTGPTAETFKQRFNSLQLVSSG